MCFFPKEFDFIVVDFSCAVESTVLLHGRMYITTKYICFYSNLFGLEKKIRIPYSHIKSISKENTAMVIPNAIAIATGIQILFGLAGLIKSYHFQIKETIFFDPFGIVRTVIAF